MSEVSISSNALDLYAPKFGLDILGQSGERIFLKMIISADAKRLCLYGSYTIGSRHAQISSDLFDGVGDTVKVLSVTRFNLQEAVSEIN